MFRTLELRAIAIPTGIPIITHNAIPTTTIVVVSIALSQNLGLRNPIKKVQKATKTVVPIFFPLEKYVIAITAIITSGQGASTIKFFTSE